MGKTSICIEMLKMLNTGRVIKISEFAEHFETNPRNIIEYRKELELAGYCIDIIPGKYGGYKLNKSNLFPTLSMTAIEKKAIRDAYDYAMSKKDFMNKDDLNSAMSKIMSNTVIPAPKEELIVVDKYQLTMDEKDIQERYLFIEKAIKEKKEIQISYNSMRNGLKEHVLHPYKLFIYNNSWFFLAWNPEVGDVWSFKVNRIQDYELTNKKFAVWKYFDASKYFDDHGFKNNGDYYHIELIANKKRAMLMKERVYGKNQVVEELGDDKVKVCLEMQNKELIISYILSCGTDVEVLEPQWLKQEIINKIEQIINFYK